MPDPAYDAMPIFNLLSSAKGRLGRLAVGQVVLDTPTFLAPTSRGAVPHLSHDNLRDHTAVRAVYVALEDFIERKIGTPPVLQSSSLRHFTSHPTTSIQLLAPRRSTPVTAAASNTDTSLSILTSVGFDMLPITSYISSAAHLRPDVCIAPADIPPEAPGKSRAFKMVDRTETWLDGLLKAKVSSAIWAAVLPLSVETQRWYLESLLEKPPVSGLALYDSTVAAELPENLRELVRVGVDEAASPLRALRQVLWGVDVVLPGFMNAATEAGIALQFDFPGTAVERGAPRKVLGFDLWDNLRYATDLGPLMAGCGCYACRKHHRAFVAHLLQAKEMTAWVLLQIHNATVVDKFFSAIRRSLAAGTFERDSDVFEAAWESELPKQTGQGPRIRGYQFKASPGTRQNPKAYNKLGGDQKEAVSEAMTPPDVSATMLEEGGFAETLSK